MALSDSLSMIISLGALVISLVTAYRTLFAKFNGDVFVKPRIALIHTNGQSSIVLKCEIVNTGAKTGAIDDIMLFVKYHQKKSVNSYTFFPIFSRENYSIFKAYQETDFDPFESISVPANSHLSKHVVFSPSLTNFAPAVGELNLSLYFRCSNEKKWSRSKSKIEFVIDDELSSIWGDPNGKSILVETHENDQYRNGLMNGTVL